MSNEFLDLAKLAFAESIAITGATKFRLRGAEKSGSLTDLTEEEKFEMGQIIANVVATLEFPYERFTPALVNGEKVSFPRDGGTKVLRIGRVEADEVSIRIALADPNE